MKTAVKYGLLTTLGAIAWVVIAHLIVPDPRSSVHSLGAGMFFNILHIGGIYLAISSVKNEMGGELIFKTGIKTGMITAFIFATSFCLFFLISILAIGPKFLAREPGAESQPIGQVAVRAFLGLFLGTIIFGLIYSTLISFFLAKRRGVTQ
jgi:hypothetical protein